MSRRLEALIDAITPQAVAEHVTSIISNPANLKMSPADDVKVQYLIIVIASPLIRRMSQHEALWAQLREMRKSAPKLR
jgi:hypothetical protein